MLQVDRRLAVRGGSADFDLWAGDALARGDVEALAGNRKGRDAVRAALLPEELSGGIGGLIPETMP